MTLRWALACAALAGCGGDGARSHGPTPASGARAHRADPPTAEQAPQIQSVELRIAVSGDLLAHLPIVSRARALAGQGGRNAFDPMFRALRPLVRRADIGFCHLETPLVPGRPTGYPLFRTPPALARAIRRTG